MAWRVFYSYSTADKDWRKRLATHLATLRRQNRIEEWYDRKIEPGADWDRQICDRLESADLFLVLVSAEFLDSDYCFGVEMERALTRLKRGEAKVVPVLVRPCLWEDSVFSEIQMIPRGAKALSQHADEDEALMGIAAEIRDLVSGPAPSVVRESGPGAAPRKFDNALDLVREQVRVYARLYERTRQRMKPSHVRTQRMQDIFDNLRQLATAAYPLLDELCVSPSPGDRLAAVAILRVFACERHLAFLSHLIGADKPFMGYQAAKALRFAVNALDPRSWAHLSESIVAALEALKVEPVKPDSDRMRILIEASQQLKTNIEALGTPPAGEVS